jgi:hypothetical protein
MLFPLPLKFIQLQHQAQVHGVLLQNDFILLLLPPHRYQAHLDSSIFVSFSELSQVLLENFNIF